MPSSSFLVNPRLSHHLYGWHFLSNILCLCWISRDAQDASTFSITKTSLLDMLTTTTFFLSDDNVCLSSVGGCSIGVSTPSNELVPHSYCSLSLLTSGDSPSCPLSSLLNSPLSLLALLNYPLPLLINFRVSNPVSNSTS